MYPCAASGNSQSICRCRCLFIKTCEEYSFVQCCMFPRIVHVLPFLPHKKKEPYKNACSASHRARTLHTWQLWKLKLLDCCQANACGTQCLKFCWNYLGGNCSVAGPSAS